MTAARTDLHPFVAETFDADPILASEMGDTSDLDSLGTVNRSAIADRAARRSRQLIDAEGTDPGAPGTDRWLEHQLLLTELRNATALDMLRPHERAAYLYPERIGDALTAVLRPAATSRDADVRLRAGEHLAARLRDVPRYLAEAAANLTAEAPALWSTMGIEAGDGLQQFLGSVVTGFAATVPAALARDLERATTEAGRQVDSYAARVRELDPTGSWVCGTEHVDALLRGVHHLDMDAGDLAGFGRSEVEAAEAALTDFAARRDPESSWQEQMSRAKDRHPQPAEFLQTYSDAMHASAEHTRAAGLLSVPDGQLCRMDWVPEYQRSALPLGVMNTVPPYSDGLVSEFLITPADPAASDERRTQHMRDNCFAFAASIAGHETYPGHHLQAVHHQLGTPRESLRRFSRSPQFVEGWGLYVEDLLAETGFFDDEVLLFARRNALWRALRVVIDVGLHTGTLDFDGAVAVLCTRAGMENHMATGEVRRYTRHDNPTYPSSYLLGRTHLHRLRRDWQQRHPDRSLREFHDRLLANGSPPVPLVRRMLLDG